MSTAGGPYTERSGLVFGYDTGYNPSSTFDHTISKTRHYKGTPATNLFTVLGSPSYSDQNVTFSVNGTGTFKRVAVGTVIGDYTVTAEDVVYSYDLGGNGCHYHGNDYSSVSTGAKVSLNIEYFLTDDVSIVTNYLGNFEQLAGVGGSWGSVSSETNKWHKVSLTRTATGTGNLRMLMYPGGCSSSTLSSQGTIYYKNPTVTLTDSPVPFSNGTRSTTESLLDLTGNDTINVVNTSFDSNGLPTFDGTDDYIAKTRNQYAITDNWSVEVVFKPTNDSDTSWNGLFGGSLGAGGYWMFHSSGNLTYYEGYDGATRITYRPWTKANTFNQNVYHHLVITYTSTGSTTGTYNLYYNGGEKTDSFNWTFTFSHSLDSRFIGAGDGRFGTNDIHVYREFNRVLTSAEVLQNYNAYKNRFNL